MIAGVLLRNRLGVSLAAAIGAVALALAFSNVPSKDDPIAAPASAAEATDPYQDRTGAFPGAR